MYRAPITNVPRANLKPSPVPAFLQGITHEVKPYVPMRTGDYTKVDLTDEAYAHVKYNREHGMFACDAVDHNEPAGCSNPDCFKFNGPDDTESVVVPMDAIFKAPNLTLYEHLNSTLYEYPRPVGKLTTQQLIRDTCFGGRRSS